MTNFITNLRWLMFSLKKPQNSSLQMAEEWTLETWRHF